MPNCRRTNILSLGRCGSYPVCSGVDAIPKGEGVIIFAVDSTPQTLDSRNRRFGCTRRDYVNWAAEKFLSLQGFDQLNSHVQRTSIHHPKF